MLFCGFSDIHPLIKEHATLRVEATFSRYELACGNASSYPENVASSRRVGACRFCMQNLIKKNFTFIFTKKIILIPLELKLLLNDKMINYKQKRQINFTSIKESPYWLNNFPKHHPSYESVLNFVRPIYLLSFLIVFLFMFGSISFVACIFRSTDQLTAELTKLCGICDIAIIFIYFSFWPFSQNNVEILQHRTLQERCQAAEMLKKSSGCSTPILVDTMDNEATQAYGAYPERLFIIQDRKIVYEGGTGPYNYKLWEVKKWLEVYKASR